MCVCVCTVCVCLCVRACTTFPRTSKRFRGKWRHKFKFGVSFVRFCYCNGHSPLSLRRVASQSSFVTKQINLRQRQRVQQCSRVKVIDKWSPQAAATTTTTEKAITTATTTSTLRMRRHSEREREPIVNSLRFVSFASASVEITTINRRSLWCVNSDADADAALLSCAQTSPTSSALSTVSRATNVKRNCYATAH